MKEVAKPILLTHPKYSFPRLCNTDYVIVFIGQRIIVTGYPVITGTKIAGSAVIFKWRNIATKEIQFGHVA
jgi:hypothetical protein